MVFDHNTNTLTNESYGQPGMAYWHGSLEYLPIGRKKGFLINLMGEMAPAGVPRLDKPDVGDELRDLLLDRKSSDDVLLNASNSTVDDEDLIAWLHPLANVGAACAHRGLLPVDGRVRERVQIAEDESGIGGQAGSGGLGGDPLL